MLRKNLINKKLKEDKQKLQLIEAYIKLKKKKKHEKLRKEKTNPKPKKKKKIQEYFQECIKKQFLLILLPMNKIPRKRNQLLMVLLKNKPSMENQVLFQISILRTKQPK